MNKKEIEKPNLYKIDNKRKYRIGTRYMTKLGAIFRYVKIDFGSVGKINGKLMRNIIYRWIQVRM